MDVFFDATQRQPSVAYFSGPCPPYATIDLILIFDSSSSVGAKNWKKLIKFGGNIVGTFNVARKALRVGAFRYNKVFSQTCTATRKINCLFGIVELLCNRKFGTGSTWEQEAALSVVISGVV